MKAYFVIICTLLVVTSCVTSTPFVKLTPNTTQNKDYWKLGQQFVYTRANNIWFDCAFNRKEGETIVFDVKIDNQSDSSVLVAPARCYQDVYVNDSLQIAHEKAFDPEQILMFLDLEEQMQSAQASNAAAFGIFASLISAGAKIAVETSDKKEDEKAQMVNTINASNAVVQTSTDMIVQSSNVRAENNWTTRRNLSKLFLRKTTLSPGYYIDGEIHFPYHKNAKWYKITLVVGNSNVVFWFNQDLIYPSHS